MTCINPLSNNYKFYWMKPRSTTLPGSVFDVTYGRIGSQAGEAFGVKQLQDPYEPYLYWIRYYEKLSKGYTDQSKIYLSKKAKREKEETPSGTTPEPESSGSANEASRELYRMLREFARGVVEKTLVDSNGITEKQIAKSKSILKVMSERKTVNGFNKQLEKLLVISPRKARYISEAYAKSKEDFPKIIAREDSLIMAMEAMVGKNLPKKVSVGSFDEYDIEVYEATPEQKEHVMKHLSDMIKPQVEQIYRVIPKTQKEAFDAYVKEKNITDIREMFHGSRNENMFSCVVNGLKTRPGNVIRTGSMLGANAIYFAPSSMKSLGYTSLQGSYWAGGRSNTGVLLLCAVAYGKALDATNDIRMYSKEELEAKGFNSVHARGGAGLYLRNDEVVVFDDNASLINYVIVLNKNAS